jgi:UDP-N-acetylglucosamine diphosphorylase/glucosamine-1-phosphate N-acetyltransferase
LIYLAEHLVEKNSYNLFYRTAQYNVNVEVTKKDQKMIVALFEDENYANFFPLTYTRPVFECRSGIFSFFERAQKMFAESRFTFFTRDYLASTFGKRVSCPVNEPESFDDDVLLINGTLIVDEKVKRLMEKKLDRNVLIKQQGRLALAHLAPDVAKKHGKELCKPTTRLTTKKLIRECKTLESSNLDFLTYPWDLIHNNAELIKKDYSGLGKKGCEGTIADRVMVYGDEKRLYVGEDAFVEAFVTLDVREGPIYIGNETVVHSGSRISGPTYIGNKTIVTSGLIREGCSVGQVCRVGGELEETIIHGYTNKYHTGFIGHAYIGEWVNLGAATTNSDLKNTYGTVHVATRGKKFDTGQKKVGCFIGDHAKTSIGTQIYTGRKIGVASHAHGFVTEDVPSFTIWGKSLGAKPVELEPGSAIRTQERVLSRRGVKQTREDVKLLEELFQITVAEREETGVLKERFVL